MQKVDAEIRRILDEQYALARNLIETTATRCKPWPRRCSNGKPSTASRSTTSWPAGAASAQGLDADDESAIEGTPPPVKVDNAPAAA
jgi:hypothetical protein